MPDKKQSCPRPYKTVVTDCKGQVRLIEFNDVQFYPDMVIKLYLYQYRWDEKLRLWNMLLRQGFTCCWLLDSNVINKCEVDWKLIIVWHRLSNYQDTQNAFLFKNLHTNGMMRKVSIDFNLFTFSFTSFCKWIWTGDTWKLSNCGWVKVVKDYNKV